MAAKYNIHMHTDIEKHTLKDRKVQKAKKLQTDWERPHNQYTAL